MKTIVPLISVSMTPLQKERIDIIDSEDYSGVISKVKEEHPELNTEKLEEGILALKQYYAVALLDPKNEHAVSDKVDPFWHAHILHTKQYTDFCNRVFGHYIHHTPLNHADKKAVSIVGNLYRHTESIYKKIFKGVNRFFFPEEMPEARLICFHMAVQNPEIVQEGLFDQVTSPLGSLQGYYSRV
jgi:hypothetical protein